MRRVTDSGFQFDVEMMICYRIANFVLDFLIEILKKCFDQPVLDNKPGTSLDVYNLNSRC